MNAEDDALGEIDKLEREILNISQNLRRELDYLDREKLYAKRQWARLAKNRQEIVKGFDKDPLWVSLPEFSNVMLLTESGQHIIEASEQQLKKCKDGIAKMFGAIDKVITQSRNYIIEKKEERMSEEELSKLDHWKVLINKSRRESKKKGGKMIGRSKGLLLMKLGKDKELNDEERVSLKYFVEYVFSTNSSKNKKEILETRSAIPRVGN